MPKDGSTHWSTRKLAEELGISHMRVARTWAKAGLQPHRLRRYMASDDPDFHKKAADVIGLYLKPPPMPRFSVWMRRRRFRRWIGWTPFCRYRPVAPSVTVLNTSVTGHFTSGTQNETGEVLGKTAGNTPVQSCGLPGELSCAEPKKREIM